MSSKGNLIGSVIVLILGAVFAWYSNQSNLAMAIIYLCGLAFVIPGAISLVSVVFSKRKEGSGVMRMTQAICGVGGLGLGLCIIFIPGVFRPLLSYAFGALLVVGGLIQEVRVSRRNHVVGYPGWLQIVPLVLIVAGVVLCCLSSLHTPEGERWMMLIVGIAGILYGVNGIIIASLSGKASKPVEVHNETHTEIEKQAEQETTDDKTDDNAGTPEQKE